MFNFKLICLVIFLFKLQQIKSQISDKRYCANENCTKPISQAKTILPYLSPDYRILSFQQNADVTVYSKSAGSNMDLWGIEVNGKRGYAPKRFLRETKVFTKVFPYLVDTELNDEQVPSKETEKDVVETIAADKVSEYDVVDGTTIYYTPEEKIDPTATETDIKATVIHEHKDSNEEIGVDDSNKATEPLQLSNVKSDSNNLENNQVLVEGNNSEKEEIKDSLVDNLYQSIQNWIAEPEKKEEVNTRDDKYDLHDDEDYEDEDDEEEDSSEEDESDADVEIEEENNNVVEDNRIKKAENEQSLDNEEIKTEDTIKSRQLLSEKDEDSDSLSPKETEEISNEEKSEPDTLPVNKEKIENITDILSNECSEENCLKKEENQENNSKSVSEAESVTESFKEASGFEIPLPKDEDFVTPNPMETDQLPTSINVDKQENEDGKEDIKNSDNLENIVEENKNLEINKENENLETLKDENVELTKEDENLETIEEGSISSGATEETNINLENETNNLDKTEVEQVNDLIEENIENDQNSNSSEESNISDSISQKEEDLKDESLDVENNQNSDSSEESNISDSISQKEEDLKDESLDVKIYDKSIDTEAAPDDNNENVPSAPTNTEENPEKEEPLSEETQEEINEQTPDLPVSTDVSTENPDDNIIDNTAGILTGIYSNWFQHPNEDKTGETVSQNQDNLNSIDENVIEDKKEEENIQEVKNEEISENLNEKHDHSFVSMIIEPKEESTSEKLESNQFEEESVVSEVPKTEIITEDVIKSDSIQEENKEDIIKEESQNIDMQDHLLSKENIDYGSCPADGDCPTIDISAIEKQLEMEEELAKSLDFNYSDYFNLFTVLSVTGLSVVIFMLGYISIDKSRREGPLIAKINSLEKALLVSSKENALLTDKVTDIQNEAVSENSRVSNEELDNMKLAYQELLATKSALEEQIQSLEKELENSTEVALELNRMLQDILSSQNGSDILIANVEQLQRQLVEQQATINTINDTLNLKDTENHELQLELEIKNKKVTHLQAELDKMAMNLFKVEEDKEQMQAKLESEIIELKDQFEKNKNTFNSTRTKLLDDINALKSKFSETQRNLELKTNEYTILKDNFNQIQSIKNNTEALQSLLNASSMKAELQQLQRDNQTLNDVLRQEQQNKFTIEKQIEIALQEAQSYKVKYDEADKGKLEALTKLEVLSNYFKEKEGQLQKELNKHESLWLEQQGEATSTVERIKYMQGELQNYKLQNESLKQEIVSQEVDLKSQISLLEKKAHENWVAARQAERRTEDARQEAAQLRNRLTLKERSFIEDKGQNRIQSPLEQNGDVAVSPLHMPVESPASPPLLYGTRDHLTTSPPIPNMPPFLPPPPGVPFMPPPIPGVPGFMPPPPNMFSVDHRPPPLGRMSSPPPPLNSRYSPDSRYSPYDRNSPSPLYDDDYGPSPPPPLHRGYSPYNNRDDRRDFKRPPPPPPGRTNGRNKGAISSGSGNSNESLEKLNRHHSKV